MTVEYLGEIAGRAASGPAAAEARDEMVGGGTASREDPSPFFKDETPFIRHPDWVLESRLELQSDLITPNRLFFVRKNSGSATDIDPSTWHLTIEGDAIDRPVKLSYDEIRSMPSRSLMNGEELPRDHGYPLRAVVPGWIGGTSIKWLGRIVVSSEQIWTRNNTTSYVLIGEEYRDDPPADGELITTQVINSALALPWPAELPAGTHRIHGFAHSPDGPVTRVEWSSNHGASWRDAELTASHHRYSWAKFSFPWTASPGEHTLMTRATDAAGATQPNSVPFNVKGYLFNEPLPHPIRVA